MNNINIRRTTTVSIKQFVFVLNQFNW